ncbi:CinA family protein [bacterium]|nr:CinA family protein [bacterium]
MPAVDCPVTGPAAELLTRLKSQGRWLLTAESCTAGRLAAALTHVPGCSAVYLGGVVAYNVALKQQLLGVSPAILRRVGAVSPETARAMASGALELAGREGLGSRVALATTGVAGPEPLEGDGEGQASKPAGLVYIAYASARQSEVRELRLSGSREEVLAQAVDAALALALQQLA